MARAQTEEGCADAKAPADCKRESWLPRGPRRAVLVALVIGATLVMGVGACQQVQYGGGGDDEEDWEPPNHPPWFEEGEDEADSDPSTSEGQDEGETKLDMPEEDPGLDECKRVDLLFVIDNSDSMLAEQQNLIASFDAFVSGIQDNLDEANDYHVGVVTSDAYALNEEGCREIGALVTRSSAGECGPFSEGRFITLADELEPSFTCAAAVGGGGDNDEHQLEAAIRAIGPELGQVGGCNEGFSRDDALLVLVLITDEDDGGGALPGSPGGPAQWFDQIVARKGVETNVVVLALAGVLPNACDDLPDESAQVAFRIEDFVEAFTFGEMGDVCSSDYGPFFADALALIHDACLGFTPEG